MRGAKRDDWLRIPLGVGDQRGGRQSGNDLGGCQRGDDHYQRPAIQQPGVGASVNGGTLKLNNSWNSSGALAQSGGTLYLGGNFTLADWGSVSGTNGTICLSGRLSNTDDADVDAASGSWVIQGGAVYGGTIVTTNGASLMVSVSGTLDGVTVNGVLDVGST